MMPNLPESFYALTREYRKLQNPFSAPVDDEAEPPWDGADANDWKVFLGTSAGQRLRAKMNFVEQASNRNAVLRPTGCDYNAGRAAGFHEALRWLINLSANVPPHPDTDNPPSIGAAGVIERHAP